MSARSTWEEIDELAPGADYGWNVREGFCATDSDTNCGPPPAGMTNPIFAYHHNTECTTVAGGDFVPKGVWPAAYDDDYIYADFACGKMFRLSPNGTGGYNQILFGTDFPMYGVNGLAFGAFQAKDALYYWFWGDHARAAPHRLQRRRQGRLRAFEGRRPRRGSRSCRRSTRVRRRTVRTARRSHSPPATRRRSRPRT